MNRAILFLISVSGVSSLLLIDSAIKGSVLLLFAAGVVFFLRRDSAATRHLVWLVAISAMLAMPLLSAVLPQWRVLPEWASVAQVKQGNRNGSHVKNGNYENDDSHASYDSSQFDVADNAQFSEAAIPRLVTAELPTLADNTKTAPPVTAASARWPWRSVLVAVWFAGFVLLVIRLIMARLFLWRTERTAPAKVVSALRACEDTSDNLKIFTTCTAACTTLNIRQQVTLLLHPDKTIPVVWGIFRPRLMLPAAAQDWSDEQLRSVLLHELAHIKRRDVLGQLLAQLACALHWFNPLVWFAAWRLHVERERACDDLVLQSGVRASAYAEHLLNIATGLSSSPWRQACGLAMTRSSSLHDRLTAVLNEKQNRRRVTITRLVLSSLLSVSIVVPVAMLRAADEQTPTADSSGPPDKQHGTVQQPVLNGSADQKRQFNPRDATVRLSQRLSEDTPTRTLELIYLLRNYKVFCRSDEWADATRELMRIGEPSLLALITELDRTDNDDALRAIVFALRAMNDPRAIPVLIRAIPKALQPPGSDCGVKIDDPELFAFMSLHDRSTDIDKTAISIGRPVNEILETLQKLTGHTFPEGKDTLRKVQLDDSPQQAKQRQLYAERQQYWQAWWAQHGSEFLPANDLQTFGKATEVPQIGSDGLDDVDRAGLARFGVLFPAGPGVKVGEVHEVELFHASLIDTPCFIDFDRKLTRSNFDRAQRAGLSERSGTRWTVAAGIDLHCGATLQEHDSRMWLIDNSNWATIEAEINRGLPLKPGPELRFGMTTLSPEQNTLLFLTREGGQGILQLDEYDKSKGSRMIRFRMWQPDYVSPLPPAADVAVASDANWSEPVRVYLEEPGPNATCGWSISRNQTLELSEADYSAKYEAHRNSLNEIPDLQQWQQDNAATFMTTHLARQNEATGDQLFGTQDQQEAGVEDILSLTAFDCAALTVRRSDFRDMHAGTAIACMDAFLNARMTGFETNCVFGSRDHTNLPKTRTYLFRLRDGTTGILQITQSSVGDGTLSFQYKLASTARVGVNKPTPRSEDVRIAFARVRLAKARADLSQRLEANKKVPAFSQEEIEFTQSEVKEAEATLNQMLADK